ncbi:MAG: hypothetical protein GX025_10880 [Clostridiales bacterium]|nr:hypothetical protein [Clostridiales bacterium]
MPLRRVEDEILAAAYRIDRETDRFNQQERYQRERDAKNSVSYLPDLEQIQGESSTETAAIDKAMYWDTLRSLDRETALILVLRFCMGYAGTEIAAGLNLSYHRVKRICSTQGRGGKRKGARKAEGQGRGEGSERSEGPEQPTAERSRPKAATAESRDRACEAFSTAGKGAAQAGRRAGRAPF